MNKPVYIDLSILDLNKTVIFKFWYDYVKPEYGKNPKLCYGYRQLHCLCKNRQYLQIRCKRY